ncbi:MAG: class I SAM-dependent methyltransferase [Ilumatobacteraceae bacterium]
MSSVWYGPGVADDSEFRLCGDVSGKRAIELGVTATPASVAPNAITLARLGAKTIAVDPSAEAITAVRQHAHDAEVRVECHQSELADLGFATSGSVDLVLSAGTLDDVDDLPRLLRQVHRVLRPDASFVLSLTHPIAAMFDGSGVATSRYGSRARSISELFMSLERSNFRIDVMHEPMPIADRSAMAPSVLLIRARKQGV